MTYNLKLITLITLAILLVFVISQPAQAEFTMAIDAANFEFGTKGDTGWDGGYRQLKNTGTGYFNRAVCKSDQGKTWYLRIRVTAPLKNSSANIIPLSSVRWMSTYAGHWGTDKSSQLNHSGSFVAFSETPETVFTSLSTGGDVTGEEVEVQFIYDITIDDSIVAGTYSTNVEYSMTE